MPDVVSATPAPSRTLSRYVNLSTKPFSFSITSTKDILSKEFSYFCSGENSSLVTIYYGPFGAAMFGLILELDGSSYAQTTFQARTSFPVAENSRIQVSLDAMYDDNVGLSPSVNSYAYLVVIVRYSNGSTFSRTLSLSEVEKGAWKHFAFSFLVAGSLPATVLLAFDMGLEQTYPGYREWLVKDVRVECKGAERRFQEHVAMLEDAPTIVHRLASAKRVLLNESWTNEVAVLHPIEYVPLTLQISGVNFSIAETQQVNGTFSLSKAHAWGEGEITLFMRTYNCIVGFKTCYSGSSSSEFSAGENKNPLVTWFTHYDNWVAERPLAVYFKLSSGRSSEKWRVLLRIRGENGWFFEKEEILWISANQMAPAEFNLEVPGEVGTYSAEVLAVDDMLLLVGYGCLQFSVGELNIVTELRRDSNILYLRYKVTGYPLLADEKHAVTVYICDTSEDQPTAVNEALMSENGYWVVYEASVSGTIAWVGDVVRFSFSIANTFSTALTYKLSAALSLVDPEDLTPALLYLVSSSQIEQVSLRPGESAEVSLDLQISLSGSNIPLRPYPLFLTLRVETEGLGVEEVPVTNAILLDPLASGRVFKALLFEALPGRWYTVSIPLSNLPYGACILAISASSFSRSPSPLSTVLLPLWKYRIEVEDLSTFTDNGYKTRYFVPGEGVLVRATLRANPGLFESFPPRVEMWKLLGYADESMDPSSWIVGEKTVDRYALVDLSKLVEQTPRKTLLISRVLLYIPSNAIGLRLELNTSAILALFVDDALVYQRSVRMENETLLDVYLDTGYHELVFKVIRWTWPVYLHYKLYKLLDDGAVQQYFSSSNRPLLSGYQARISEVIVANVRMAVNCTFVSNIMVQGSSYVATFEAARPGRYFVVCEAISDVLPETLELAVSREVTVFAYTYSSSSAFWLGNTTILTFHISLEASTEADESATVMLAQVSREIRPLTMQLGYYDPKTRLRLLSFFVNRTVAWIDTPTKLCVFLKNENPHSVVAFVNVFFEVIRPSGATLTLLMRSKLISMDAQSSTPVSFVVEFDDISAPYRPYLLSVKVGVFSLTHNSLWNVSLGSLILLCQYSNGTLLEVKSCSADFPSEINIDWLSPLKHEESLLQFHMLLLDDRMVSTLIPYAFVIPVKKALLDESATLATGVQEAANITLRFILEDFTPLSSSYRVYAFLSHQVVEMRPLGDGLFSIFPVKISFFNSTLIAICNVIEPVCDGRVTSYLVDPRDLIGLSLALPAIDLQLLNLSAAPPNPVLYERVDLNVTIRHNYEHLVVSGLSCKVIIGGEVVLLRESLIVPPGSFNAILTFVNTYLTSYEAKVLICYQGSTVAQASLVIHPRKIPLFLRGVNNASEQGAEIFVGIDWGSSKPSYSTSFSLVVEPIGTTVAVAANQTVVKVVIPHGLSARELALYLVVEPDRVPVSEKLRLKISKLMCSYYTVSANQTLAIIELHLLNDTNTNDLAISVSGQGELSSFLLQARILKIYVKLRSPLFSLKVSVLHASHQEVVLSDIVGLEVKELTPPLLEVAEFSPMKQKLEMALYSFFKHVRVDQCAIKLVVELSNGTIVEKLSEVEPLEPCDLRRIFVQLPSGEIVSLRASFGYVQGSEFHQLSNEVTLTIKKPFAPPMQMLYFLAVAVVFLRRFSA